METFRNEPRCPPQTLRLLGLLMHMAAGLTWFDDSVSSQFRVTGSCSDQRGM